MILAFYENEGTRVGGLPGKKSDNRRKVNLVQRNKRDIAVELTQPILPIAHESGLTVVSRKGKQKSAIERD